MDYRAYFKIKLNEIIEEDARFKADAYYFVSEAVTGTAAKLQRDDENRHISGQELLEGLRELTIEKFGPMSLTLLEEWGIHNTLDFGHIVFNLVEKGLLGKQDDDSIDDFRDGYDFKEAFKAPFEPTKRKGIFPIL